MTINVDYNIAVCKWLKLQQNNIRYVHDLTMAKDRSSIIWKLSVRVYLQPILDDGCIL